LELNTLTSRKEKGLSGTGKRRKIKRGKGAQDEEMKGQTF